MITYSYDDLETDIERLITELSSMREMKGSDYSGEVDTLDNLRDFGWWGVVVRIGDKYKRLKRATMSPKLKVPDESVEDTMKDLINYALFLLIMYRQAENQQNDNHRES